MNKLGLLLIFLLVLAVFVSAEEESEELSGPAAEFTLKEGGTTDQILNLQVGDVTYIFNPGTTWAYDSATGAVSCSPSCEITTPTNSFSGTVTNFRCEDSRCTAESASYATANGLTGINVVGFEQTPDWLRFAQASSITFGPNTFANVYDFFTNWKVYQMARADLVIVETSRIEATRNIELVIRDNKLVWANFTSGRDKNLFKFPNLISHSSKLVVIEADNDESFTIKRDVDEAGNDLLEVVADENVTVSLPGDETNAFSNVSFESEKDGAVFSVVEDPVLPLAPRHGVAGGMLNYSSRDAVEQLYSLCELSEVNVNFAIGFTRLVLQPEKVIVLCPGARYNFINKSFKEASYSIYNIGSANYYLGFEKGLAFEEFNNWMGLLQIVTPNWGWIERGHDTELKGVIQYDRFPELALFPALSAAEYAAQTGVEQFRKVYASYLYGSNATISYNSEKISLKVRSVPVPTPAQGQTIIEVNAGFFNLKEIQAANGIRRYGSFNKALMHPDYVMSYDFNNAPLIKVEDKTLIQSTLVNGIPVTQVKMYTPASESEQRFMDWLKVRAAIKEVAQFAQKLAALMQAGG